MNASQEDTYRYDRQGTLSKPGPFGRLVRFAMGLLMLWIVYLLLYQMDLRDLHNGTVWLWVAITFWILPPVVTIGFGKTWNAWKIRTAFLTVVLAGAITSYVLTSTIDGIPLWWALKTSMLYFFGHLGVSFLLSSFLRTPGCEMRAIPQLIGMITGRASDEHYCPGFIGCVDRWEADLHKK